MENETKDKLIQSMVNLQTGLIEVEQKHENLKNKIEELKKLLNEVEQTEENSALENK